MLPKFQLASQDALRSLGHLLPGAGQRRPRGQWRVQFGLPDPSAHGIIDAHAHNQ
jgi:hypothetical protein